MSQPLPTIHAAAADLRAAKPRRSISSTSAWNASTATRKAFAPGSSSIGMAPAPPPNGPRPS